MAGIIPFAGPENDIHVIEFPWVGHVRQIFVRAVEINIVVVVAVEKIADFEGTAQANEVTNHVGMFESDIAGVISAKTRAANSYPMRASFTPRKVEYIAHNDIFVSDVGANPVCRMNALVVKAVEIDRVRAIHRNAIVVYEPCDGVDQPEIFVLMITTEGRGKGNQGQPAAVAEDEHLELATQIWRPPLDMTFLHRLGGGRYRRHSKD